MSEHEIDILKKRIAELEKLDAERKQAGQAHREDEIRFRALFEGSLDGIIIMDGNTPQLLDLNRQAHEMLGYTREEYCKLSIPKDIEAIESSEEIHRHTNLILEHGMDIFETKHRTKKGEILDISVTAYTTVFDGKKTIYATFRNITKRKQAEEKLKQIVEEWKSTFDSISDLIFLQDKDYIITRVNKAFADALKLKPEDIVGKKCYELLHKRETPWPECPFEKTLYDSKPHAEEVDDPNIGIPLLVTTSPILNEKSEIIGSVHIAKNISEIKKARQELEAKIRDLERFQKVTMDREKRIIELKEEVKKMKAELEKRGT